MVEQEAVIGGKASPVRAVVRADSVGFYSFLFSLVRLAPFIRQPALAYGLFGGPSANAGWAVRCIGSHKGGILFFVAKSCSHTAWPTTSNKKAQTAFFLRKYEQYITLLKNKNNPSVFALMSENSYRSDCAVAVEIKRCRRNLQESPAI